MSWMSGRRPRASAGRRREATLEAERVPGRPVLPEVIQTALCLFDGWDVSRRNPPQDKVGAFDVLEELLPPPEDGCVIRVVGVLEQGIEILPDTEVDKDHWVTADPNRCGVAVVCLVTPDEAL